ncbi:bromodomain adjacent to zinc finger domain protein 2A isoform X1, partial [Tachysurus ichikawai]
CGSCTRDRYCARIGCLRKAHVGQGKQHANAPPCVSGQRNLGKASRTLLVHRHGGTMLLGKLVREIDNTLENMTTYKKNKWITEGKVRKMKAALARKTGRSEDELCLEERRRSTRVCVAEDETLPNSSFLENGSSRQRKDELKIYEVVHHLSCNITEFAILLLTYAAAYRLCWVPLMSNTEF